MIVPSDIALTLSGGETNDDPSKSLGGKASSRLLIGTLNNLFDDLTTTEARNGKTDYRCFYLFNDNLVNLWSDLKIWFSQTPDCCRCLLGTTSVNEVQQIKFGEATGGTAQFKFGDSYFAVNYSTNASIMSSNIQSALRRLNDLSDVTCTSVSQNIFNINFIGEDGHRAQPLLTVTSNNLIPSGTSCTVQRTKNGSPINADSIKTMSTVQTPYNVHFAAYTATSPLEIGNLYPGDRIALWIQRNVASKTGTITNASFRLQFSGIAKQVPEVISSDHNVIGSGGIIVSGSALFTQYYTAVPGSEPTIGGTAIVRYIQNHYVYPQAIDEMLGGPILGGTYEDFYVIPVSDHYDWIPNGGVTLGGTAIITQSHQNPFLLCDYTWFGRECTSLPTRYKLETTGIHAVDPPHDCDCSVFNGTFDLDYIEGSCGLWEYTQHLYETPFSVRWILRYVGPFDFEFTWQLSGILYLYSTQCGELNMYWDRTGGTSTTYPQWTCCGENVPDILNTTEFSGCWGQDNNNPNQDVYTLKVYPDPEASCLTTIPSDYSITGTGGIVVYGESDYTNPYEECGLSLQYRYPAQYLLITANIGNDGCHTCSTWLNGFFLLHFTMGSCDWTTYDPATGVSWRLWMEIGSSGYLRWNIVGTLAGCGIVYATEWGSTGPTDPFIGVCGNPDFDAVTILSSDGSCSTNPSITIAMIKAIGDCNYAS